jgi:uncharacterized protein YndB with AHSA1/START domain
MLTQAKTADFVITRVFDAPPDVLWKCFTEPERMKEWFGPKGGGRRRQNGFARRRHLSRRDARP